MGCGGGLSQSCILAYTYATIVIIAYQKERNMQGSERGYPNLILIAIYTAKIYLLTKRKG